MPFIWARNVRFKRNMWSDKCVRGDESSGRVCPIHQKFMDDTRAINIAAPIFACLEFEEDKTVDDLVEPLYEKSQEDIETVRAEKYCTFANTWEEQQKMWGVRVEDLNLRSR
jgi:hypothetical protein